MPNIHCTNCANIVQFDFFSNFFLKVGNNEGSLMTGVKLPNLLGRGERLQVLQNQKKLAQFFPPPKHEICWINFTSCNCTEFKADYTYGTKKSSNFNLSLLKPLRGKLRSSLTGNVYQVEHLLFVQVL